MLPPFLHGLDLNAQQQSDIKTKLTAHSTLKDETWKNGHAFGIQLHQLSFSNDYSEDKATGLIEKSVASHKQQVLQKTNLDNAIFKLLTGEQPAALEAKLDKLESYAPF